MYRATTRTHTHGSRMVLYTAHEAGCRGQIGQQFIRSAWILAAALPSAVGASQPETFYTFKRKIGQHSSQKADEHVAGRQCRRKDLTCTTAKVRRSKLCVPLLFDVIHTHTYIHTDTHRVYLRHARPIGRHRQTEAQAAAAPHGASMSKARQQS